MAFFDEDYDPFADVDQAVDDEEEAMAAFSRIVADDEGPPEEPASAPQLSDPGTPEPKAPAAGCNQSPTPTTPTTPPSSSAGSGSSTAAPGAAAEAREPPAMATALPPRKRHRVKSPVPQCARAASEHTLRLPLLHSTCQRLV